MVLTADVHRMFDVADQILAVGLPRFAQERHEIHACDAASIGQGFQFRIGGVARQVDQRTAASVGDCHRRLRGGDPLGDGFNPRVAQVQQQVQPIHLGDEIISQLAQAAVRFLHAAVADDIAQVVGRLNDAHAEVGEHREARKVALKHGRILAAVDDSQSMRGFCRLNITAAQNLHEYIGVRQQFMFDAGHIGDGAHEFVRPVTHIVDGQIDRRDARCSNVRQGGRRQRRVIRRIRIEIPHATQGVDNDGAVVTGLRVPLRCGTGSRPFARQA
jgi:hypothetical protein